MKQQKATKNKFSFHILSLLIISAVVLQGCDVITSPAEPKISNFSCDSDFGVINGEADAGVSVSFVIKNIGDAGKINIMPKLSTSEGEWRRDQTLYFNAGESKRLSYFFYEPTINATNINCSVNTIP